jgi:hypothetical protein
VRRIRRKTVLGGDLPPQGYPDVAAALSTVPNGPRFLFTYGVRDRHRERRGLFDTLFGE